jgi:type I restriction enzyme, S subunit
MRTDVSTSNDLSSTGFRLDAVYHVSEGMKSLHALNNWVASNAISDRKRILDKLGEVSDMFVGDWLKRIYVGDPAHGAPYLSGDTMLRQNPLEGGKHLSFMHGNYIDQLALKEQMIIMTCSGTIGNLLYVNSTAKGAVGSPDLLRIIAKIGKILPGYLYTFLSSRIGQALINKGIYGAVIQHIEIPYLNSLPIPRLDPILEERIHQLIEQVAKLRVSASNGIKNARRLVEYEVGFLNYSKSHDHAFTVDCGRFEFIQPFRLDSFYYSGYCFEAIKTLSQYSGKIIRAQDVGFHFYNPPLFKRQFAESGYPYMSGVDFYNLRPHTDRYLSKNQPDIDFYIVRKGTVLIQNAGQRYGLITTPIMVTRVLDGVAVTSDVIRINHKDLVENGYICALFGSGFGRRLALRYSYGTSIPRLDVPEFSNIKIPWPKDEIRRNIGQMVIDAYQQYDSANELEDQAQCILASALIVGR